MRWWDQKALRAQRAADAADSAAVVWIIHSPLVFMAIPVNINPALCRRSGFHQRHGRRQRWERNSSCLSVNPLSLTTHTHAHTKQWSWKFQRLGTKCSLRPETQSRLTSFLSRYLHSSWKQECRASKLMQYALCPIYISSGETVIKAACALGALHTIAVVPLSSRLHNDEI